MLSRMGEQRCTPSISSWGQFCAFFFVTSVWWRRGLIAKVTGVVDVPNLVRMYSHMLCFDGCVYSDEYTAETTHVVSGNNYNQFI